MGDNSQEIRFFKFHGTGNDFILINGFEFANLKLSKTQVEQLCDRHFGIGADGLIILEPTHESSFYMNYYNADGLPGSMCGNGGRCTAMFAHALGVAKKEMEFLAIDGRHKAKVLDNETVELEMKSPIPFPQRWQNGFTIDTGSPHLIHFSENPDFPDFLKKAEEIRFSDEFRAIGINVNFVFPEESEGKLLIRTYERGVETETLSCGTGAVAAALTSAFYLPEKFHSPIKVFARGGELLVTFQKREKFFDEITLTGKVLCVFSGSVRINF